MLKRFVCDAAVIAVLMHTLRYRDPVAERLTAAGLSPDMFEDAGYKRLKAKENGVCILSEDGKCMIHAIKPETCRAGPFTFDVKDDVIGIYLKFSRICPLVTLLKETPEAYQLQYESRSKKHHPSCQQSDAG